MPPSSDTKKRQLITAFSVLLLLVVIVGAVVVNSKSSAPAETATTTSATTVSKATYKDGTYSADAGYNTPGGLETIGVKVTIGSNKVSDVTVTTNPTDREAREYQSKFQAGYRQFVIGKAIDSIKLSRVSGSSLTSQGFNNALAKIEQQAAG